MFTQIEVRFWPVTKAHISNGLIFENRMIEHNLSSLAVGEKSKNMAVQHVFMAYPTQEFERIKTCQLKNQSDT